MQRNFFRVNNAQTTHKTEISKPPFNKKATIKPSFLTFYRGFFLEQDTGLEPAAYCLGSSRSTG